MAPGVPVDFDAKPPSALRLVASMALAGLIAGTAIIGVYDATLPTIKANQARELRAAVFRVLPGVARMQPLRPGGDGLVRDTRPDGGDDTIYGGYDADGGFVGYAIPNAGPGFQDTIKLLYGYSPAKRQVVGMWVLDSRETPGIGDKIFKDAGFVSDFDALSVEPEIRLVKAGRKVNANEVDAITGATISSKAVVRIINAANARWLDRLPAVAPALEEAPK